MKRHLRLVGFLLAAGLLAAPGSRALALEPRNAEALAGLERISLSVESRVSDGCWPQPAETRSLVAARLAEHGLQVLPEGADRDAALAAGGGRAALFLHVIGYAVDGGRTCVWFVDLSHLAWRGPFSLLRDQKSAAQLRMRDSFLKLADLFAADWVESNRGGGSDGERGAAERRRAGAKN